MKGCILDIRLTPMATDYPDAEHVAYGFTLRDFDGKDWADINVVLPTGDHRPARVQLDALEKFAQLALRVADDIRRRDAATPR